MFSTIFLHILAHSFRFRPNTSQAIAQSRAGKSGLTIFNLLQTTTATEQQQQHIESHQATTITRQLFTMSMIYPHHHPAFVYRRRPSSAHPPFLGLFLKNMFFLAAAWFAASIAIRMVVLTLSILFSPPVFLLLLLTCATSWSSLFDALRHEHSPSTTTGGRCHQSQCSRRARQHRREFCHRFQQQQCQSQRQQVQSFQKSDSETKPSSAANTEDSKSEERSNKNKERLNNFQPRRVSNDQRTPFHIEQDEQHVTLSIDVPGYSVSDLSITVDQDGTLTIAGERQNKIGRDAFAFQRQFVLSPTTMDTTSVTASVVDGLLIITIDKKEIPKPRLITSTTEAHETPDRDETEVPSEEEVEEETIAFEKSPAVEVDILLSTKKPIVVETVNDEDEEDVEIEESNPVEGDYDSWENVIKA
jgi:HSP20 family molecular chaperone IbpA